MIRTRIAPSPTGDDLHIGNAYTALINYAFAKKHGGKFLVRIEDTDRTRFVPGSEKNILDSLKWLGLLYDEGPDIGGTYQPYRQSQRLSLYKKHADVLLERGYAYHCFCTPETLSTMKEEQKKQGLPPKYDRRCLNLKKDDFAHRISTQPSVIRMKIPPGETSFTDAIRGNITIANAQLDDQVLIKSDGYPTYHLAVVIDDWEMKISHVIRGEDWISSTPKHVLLYGYFGWKLPVFAHLPLLRNPDRSKLSKRKNPVWVSFYKEQGFLPQALLNYLSLMGWSHPEGKEVFSMEEFIKLFTLERVQTVGPIFDIGKLRWMNEQKLKTFTDKQYAKMIAQTSTYKPPLKILETIVPLVKERLKMINGYDSLAGFFHQAPSTYERPVNKPIIVLIADALKKIDDDKWDRETMEKSLRHTAQTNSIKAGDLFMELRISITGKKVGPPLLESLEILGKKDTIERLHKILTA